MGLFKKTLKDRIFEACKPEIRELHTLQERTKKLQDTLETIQGKVNALRKKTADMEADITEKMDNGLSVTVPVAKLNGLKVERTEYEERAKALISKLEAATKKEPSVKRRLHASIHQALLKIMPETETKVVELVKQAVAEASAWEGEVRDLFAEYGIALERKDFQRLFTGFWALGGPIEKLSAFYRPDIDGFSHLHYQQHGRRTAKETRTSAADLT